MSKKTVFKDAFDGTWSASSKKERFVKETLERWTGKTIIDDGFGAGQDERIEGSSSSHGFEVSAPDLQVLGTDVCIEVTGPLNPINVRKELLVNVSKVKYAFEHPEREYWVAHVNGVTDKRRDVRMIRVGKQFHDAVTRGEIVREQFIARGVTNFFHAIPVDHPVVITFDRFINYIKRREVDA